MRNEGRVTSEKIVPVKHPHAKLRALGDNEDSGVKEWEVVVVLV